MDNFINPPCPVCGDTSVNEKYRFRYHSGAVLDRLNISFNDKVKLCLCKNCGHHYSVPRLNDFLINQYYSLDLSEYYRSDSVPDNILKKENEEIVELINNYKAPGQVLEIGCGNGFLLNEFKKKGWECLGIEPSEQAVKFGKEILNLNIHKGYLNDCQCRNNSFDLVILMDVIEHISEPQKFMNSILSYLKNDGILVIGTGNICSLNAIIARSAWSYFGSWEHISFYSPRSIRFLLSKVGLSHIKIIKRSYSGSKVSNLLSLIKNIKIVIKNAIKEVLNLLLNKSLKLQKVGLSSDHILVLANKDEQDI
ncbi:MAG: class I SAM-dependent methyltransferase [Ignavibacteria bacterium]|nr:class I SAM-dependent methyltransferase [Ignavibacteria bacterium]